MDCEPANSSLFHHCYNKVQYSAIVSVLPVHCQRQLSLYDDGRTDKRSTALSFLSSCNRARIKEPESAHWVRQLMPLFTGMTHSHHQV